MKYAVSIVGDTNQGPHEVQTAFDDAGELRDNIAAWLQFDFIREIRIEVNP